MASVRQALCAPGLLLNGIENPFIVRQAQPTSSTRTTGLVLVVANPSATRLAAPGWIWWERLCQLSELYIRSHIGWVDEDLVLNRAEHAGLPGPIAGGLAASRRHHGGSAARFRAVDEGRS